MQLDEVQQLLKNVIAIPVTPFQPDGSADFQRYVEIVARMVSGGIRVITPNGNTGEFYSLTPGEQQREVDATMEAVDDETLILAGVGYSAATAVEMAQYAARKGAHAVMIHQPIHPYKSDDGWIAYHRAVAEAVPGLGVVPYLRDASVGATTLARLADLCPNFVGIKYAVTNPVQFATTVQEVGAERLAWVCGVAESWAPFFWPGGATGFTSGLVNVTTELPLQMQTALTRGDYDESMRVWAQVRPFEELRARRANGNNVSIVKEAMAQLRFCEATVRPPISEVPDSEKQDVAAVLELLGVGALAAV